MQHGRCNWVQGTGGLRFCGGSLGGSGTGTTAVHDRTPVVRVPVLSKAMLVQLAKASKTAALFTRMPLLLTAAMAAM